MAMNPKAPPSQPGPPPPLKVLLFSIGSIGDTVMSVPAIRFLKTHFGPQTSFSMLLDKQEGPVASGSEVIQALDPAVTFIEYPFTRRLTGRIKTAAALWAVLRRGSYDAVVYLAPGQRGRLRVWCDRWFFRACGIRKQLGFRAFPRKELHPVDGEARPGQVPSEAWWRLERLRRDGLDCAPNSLLAAPFLLPGVEESRKVQTWLAEHRERPPKPLVAIAPGTKQPPNLWPLERFIEIGRRLSQTGACELIVIGGPGEKAMGERCLAAWGRGLDAAGAFSVAESLALIHECTFLIGLDTGTTHLAAACGVPCVAIFSDKDNPGRWSPLGEHHIILRHRVPCGGCRLIAAPCPVAGHPCLEEISVEEVWGAAEAMLQRTLCATGPAGRGEPLSSQSPP